MKTLTLTSHYYKITLNLHISDRVAADMMLEKLRRGCSMLDVINSEDERIAYGYEPKYLSRGQIRRINTFFAKDNCEYFDVAEIK